MQKKYYAVLAIILQAVGIFIGEIMLIIVTYVIMVNTVEYVDDEYSEKIIISTTHGNFDQCQINLL